MDFLVQYKVKNKMTLPDLSGISLDGEVGVRFDKYVHARASGEFAVKEILGEAERAFSEQLDDEFNYGVWRGEFWGKLALSGVASARMKNDAAFTAALRDSAYRVLSLQREDGYISTYRDNKNLFKCDAAISMRDVGWDCDYNWNLWGQKYTLWGLIEIARLTDDEKILSGAVRLADNILDTIEELGTRVKDTGVMHGLASASILKPMLILYRLTKDSRYLDFGKKIVDEMNLESGECPNAIKNAMDAIPPSQWYDPDADGWYAKAYEMTSLLEGVCELYRLTGDKKLLLALENFWAAVYASEENILGSVGYCEQYLNAKKYPDSATEICDVIHWMRLSLELFSITGDIKYSSVIENAFLNAFLAGVYEDGAWGAFFVRSAGRHYDADRQCDTKYQHCCLNNLGRGFADMAESIITVGEDGYYINSYVQSTVKLNGALFRISKGYVDNGNVSITVRGVKKGTKIFLRIPEWSSAATISVDGVKSSLKSGEYNAVVMESEEAVLYLTFDMSVRILDFAGEYFDIPDSDYHRRRWVDAKGTCDRGAMVYHPMSVIRRGPILLARSKKIGSSEADMFSGKTVFGKDVSASAVTLRHEKLQTLCMVTLKTEDKEESFLMCDYASAANILGADARFFSVFV